MATLVLTLIGDDRPGLVEAVAKVVAEHGGSWQSSRMARLAGKFAGIVEVTLPDVRADALTTALEALRANGVLGVAVERTADVELGPGVMLSLELVGQDRPGIVHEVSHALAARGVNIVEFASRTSSAPMAGEPLFEATATLRVPNGVVVDELRGALEDVAAELMVDIDVETS